MLSHSDRATVLSFSITKCMYAVCLIINLLMSPLLGHMRSLWITHMENGPLSTAQAQRGAVGADDCKCKRDQRLNVLSLV
jgi:hypothetical protein